MSDREYIVVNSSETDMVVSRASCLHCRVFYDKAHAELKALELSKKSIKLGYFAVYKVFESIQHTKKLGENDARLIETI